MNSLKKLERLFITGIISEKEYLEKFEVLEKRATMKTVEGIIAYPCFLVPYCVIQLLHLTLIQDML